MSRATSRPSVRSPLLTPRRAMILPAAVFAGASLLSACSHAPTAAPTRAATPAAARLDLTPFQPSATSLFPVLSTLVEGPTEVMLVDAQFQRNDAEALVARLRATGKRLTTIFISHGDPDYYFGLDVLTGAFPDAKVLSTASTRAHILKTKDKKVAHWGPILKANAPEHIVVPDVLSGDTLFVDGAPVKVAGLSGHDPAHTVLWVPHERVVLGGVVVMHNMHVWMADTQTKASRADWLRTLDMIDGLNPTRVIPGHAVGALPAGTTAVSFTRDYIHAFEHAAAQSADSTALIAAMQAAYPALAPGLVLELSAKVIKGEMPWPAP